MLTRRVIEDALATTNRHAAAHRAYEDGWLEDDHGAKFIAWRDDNAARFPGLEDLYHIPNGSRMHTNRKNGKGGRAAPKEALRLKAQGQNNGVSDYFLSVPVGKYHGLYVELKRHGGKPTDDQIAFLQRQEARGYAVCVAYGWREAVRAVVTYYAQGMK